MTLASEQLKFVQHQLNYHFRDISHLVPCFKAAHRSDIDNIADDGNRGLAKIGVRLMGLVEMRCFSVLGTEPRDIFHTGSNWTSSKDWRATACDNLGFTPLITTSVRQGNEMPSKNVRAATVAAIVAAVFQDLCDQKVEMAFALSKITDLLDLLAYPLKVLPNGSSELAQPQSNAKGASTQSRTEAAMPCVFDIGQVAESHNLERVGSPDIGSRPVQGVEQHSPILDFSEWIDFDGAENIAQHFPLDGNTDPGGIKPPSRSEILNPDQHHVLPQNSNLRSLVPQSNQQPATSPIQSTGTQQTVRRMPGPVIPPTRHILSLDEEIGRIINEPYTSQLRCLFNYLGSTQSILAFKRALCDLRGRKCGDNLVLKGAQSDADHLRIVKRLRENTAADSLMTICHTVKLFQDDTDNLIRHPGSFFIQTRTNFGRPRGTALGNPLNLAKAAITDRKIESLYPDLVPGSEEYRTERRYITKLRQSAAKFALFSNTFGFGILAFLPYADSFGDGYHLNKLMEIPDNHISCCIEILQQFQPIHLVHLSAGAGPIMENLINGSFWSSNPSKFEELEEREVFASANTLSATYDYLF